MHHVSRSFVEKDSKSALSSGRSMAGSGWNPSLDVLLESVGFRPEADADLCANNL